MTGLKVKNPPRKDKTGEVVIDLRGVGKKYLVNFKNQTSAVDGVFWALKNINLQIKKGSVVGFYGSNGSGKTTLFKIIAGISDPTEGNVLTKGKVVSLIDLETGFHPELTGRENIFLNGLIIGMSKKDIENKFHQIVEFADIGDFINAPLRSYSSGMKLRLGFSIAMYSNPEILLLDEVINVGDMNFQQKTELAIKEMFKKGTTVLIVSQWVNYLRANCDFLIKLDHGTISSHSINSNSANNSTNTKTVDFAALTDLIFSFLSKRKWHKYHSPENMVISFSREIAELSEYFQYTVNDAHQDTFDLEPIADELVDVLWWSLLFLRKHNIETKLFFKQLNSVDFSKDFESFSPKKSLLLILNFVGCISMGILGFSKENNQWSNEKDKDFFAENLFNVLKQTILFFRFFNLDIQTEFLRKLNKNNKKYPTIE